MFVGCTSFGIKPMKKDQINGSKGKIERQEQSTIRYATIVINPSKTNYSKVDIIDDGKVLTNVTFQIVQPAEIKVVKIKENESPLLGFWETYLLYNLIELGVLGGVIFVIGPTNIKNYIKFAFIPVEKKEENIDNSSEKV